MAGWRCVVRKVDGTGIPTCHIFMLSALVIYVSSRSTHCVLSPYGMF